MKKLLTPILLGLTILSLTACKHPGKEAETITAAAPENTDDITKNVYVDSYGEKIEVTINNTKNTATIHLNGKTFDLKKSDALPEYTASNEEYQYSDIKGNITFLKKNVDMVLFHLKQSKKESGPAKMASY
ncbi:multicopper oxidase domain-containing protein [Chryseobacterium sp. RRHN12]|uniref:multicopper oxidase domain-containing protein n=1 Tax=Chryseobacterium sp. RRHN12 TaxID=3437884 RepID=UPI002FC9253D